MMLAAHFKETNYVSVHSITKKPQSFTFLKENYFLCNNWLTIFVSAYVSLKIKMRNKMLPKILCKGNIFQQYLLYVFLFFRVNYVSKRKTRNYRETNWVPLWAPDIKRISTLSERSFSIKKYETPKGIQNFQQDTGLPAYSDGQQDCSNLIHTVCIKEQNRYHCFFSKWHSGLVQLFHSCNHSSH